MLRSLKTFWFLALIIGTAIPACRRHRDNVDADKVTKAPEGPQGTPKNDKGPEGSEDADVSIEVEFKADCSAVTGRAGLKERLVCGAETLAALKTKLAGYGDQEVLQISYADALAKWKNLDLTRKQGSLDQFCSTIPSFLDSLDASAIQASDRTEAKSLLEQLKKSGQICEPGYVIE